MGGNAPLGYDQPINGSRTLVVNDAEAAIVRDIFRDYLDFGSVHALQRRLEAEGICSKHRATRDGKILACMPPPRPPKKPIGESSESQQRRLGA